MNQIKMNSDYRELGKKTMEGHYQTTILVLLVVWVISGALMSLFGGGESTRGAASFAQLVNFALNAAFAYAFIGVWKGLLKGKEPEIQGTLLAGFKDNFVRNLLLSLLTGLFTFLWMLLFIIPGIVKSYAYSMGFYLIHRDPKLQPSDAIKESMKLTQGHKMQMFSLDLSYLGWYFIGIFTFGILWLWVYPKHMVARMALMNDIYLTANPAAAVEEKLAE
jgi:uncharacterized membrane protein